MVESDEEQLEVIKQWWDDNGTSLIVTIVLAVGGTLGYNAWDNNVREQGESASASYESLVQAATNTNGDVSGAMKTTAESIAADLKETYGDSTYAVFASLHLAKLAVDSGDLDTAQTELKWALDQNEDNLLETMIRIRLARVHIAASDPTSAMALLVNHKPENSLLGSFEEAKGDVFHALGEHDEARQAYQLAIKNLKEESSRPVLELKLADIPLAKEAVGISESMSEEGQEDDA